MAARRDPSWLERLRAAAKQRPRTQFVKVRWADIQLILHERDFLLQQADRQTREAVAAMHEEHYGRD